MTEATKLSIARKAGSYKREREWPPDLPRYCDGERRTAMAIGRAKGVDLVYKSPPGRDGPTWRHTDKSNRGV